MKRDFDFDFIDFIQFSTKIIKEKFILLFVSGVIGLGLGFGAFMIKAPSYKIKCTTEYGHLPFSIFKSQVNQINDYIKTDNKVLLAQELQLDFEKTKLIKLIELADIASADENVDSPGFAEITLVYKEDEALGAELLDAIFKYVNNSNGVKSFVQNEKKNLNERLNIATKQINSARELIGATTNSMEKAALFSELKLSQTDSLNFELQKEKINNLGENNSIKIYPIQPSLLIHLFIGGVVISLITFLYFLKNLIFEQFA